MMNRQNLAWVSIVITTVFWSSSLIFAKIVYAEMTPIVFVTLRYTLAVPFLVIAAILFRRELAPISDVKNSWHFIVAAGIFGPFLSQVMQYIGLGMTNAGETILLLNLSPVFAVILAAPLLKERVTREKVGGLTLAMLGILFIMLGGTPLEGTLDTLRLLGDTIVIISTLIFAMNGIVGKFAVNSVDSVSLTLYSTLSAVPFLWVSVFIFEDPSVILHLSPLTWGIVLWVAVVNSVIAFILYYNSMKYIEASKVQIALNLIAVWGVIMSVTVLGEVATPLLLLGGIITILGVILSQRSKPTRLDVDDL